MALITRLSRLMRADLHALLDRLEEPDILLAQALREMDDAVGADEQALAALQRRRERVQQRRQTLARQTASDDERLEVCLDAGQDDLARDLLRRRLERERLETRLGEQGQALDARIEQLGTTLEDRRRRLDALRAEAALLSERTGDRMDDHRGGQAAGHTGSGPGACSDWDAGGTAPVRDADVEVALLAAKRRRSA
jgi:phage shock protein A